MEIDDKEIITFKNETENEIKSLKRKNKLLQLFIGIMFLLLLAIAFISIQNKRFNSVRTRELIVEDNNGNERIIISSIISASKTRIRKDTLCGVLVLDKNGNDRVILGASPTVNINGKIIKRSNNGPYGMAFNDENGIEKGGFGYYEDKGLSALGLDGPSGEGIILFVPKKEMFGQKAGIIINDPQSGGQLFYIGANTKGERLINIDAQGKGRFSIVMDSTTSTAFKYYNYLNNSERVLLKSE